MLETEYDSEVPELTDSDETDSSQSDSDEECTTNQERYAQAVLTDVVVEHVTEEKAQLGIPESKISEGIAHVQHTTTNELGNHMTEGSHAFIGGQFKIAALYYQKALDVLLTQPNIQVGENEQALLKYALGMSEINTGRVKNAQNGMLYFVRILDEHQQNLHIIGHFGLAVGYFRQNRFSEAIKPLQECLSLIECDLVILPYHWPGTDTIIEDLSSVEHLKNYVEDLLSQCKAPPQPDAICRNSECVHFKRQIYYTDPECEGFVSVLCEEKCIVEYHLDCWKRLKSSSYDKRSDKEMLNTTCITPDCNQLIVKIRFQDSGGKIIKEVSSDNSEQEAKHKKLSSKVKLPSSRTSKGIERKKDRGNKEKVGKSDVRSSTMPDKEREKSVESGKGDKLKDIVDSSVAASSVTEPDVTGNSAMATSSFPILPPDATNFIAIHKKANDDEDYVATKQKKGKRLRERPKPVVVHLEEFRQRDDDSAGYYAQADDNNGEESPPFTFGARYRDPSGNDRNNEFFDIPFASYANIPCLPSLTSSNSRQSVPSVEKPVRMVAPQKAKVPAPIVEVPTSRPVEEDVKETIFSLFEQVLQNGPMEPEGELVRKELEVLPTEAQLLICQSGGIAKLLQESLKFTVVDGYICLLRDTARARTLAQRRRQELLLSAFRPPTSANVAQSTKLGLNPPKFAQTQSSNFSSNMLSSVQKHGLSGPSADPKSSNVSLSAVDNHLRKPSPVVTSGNAPVVVSSSLVDAPTNSGIKRNAMSTSNLPMSNSSPLFTNVNPNLSTSIVSTSVQYDMESQSTPMSFPWLSDTSKKFAQVSDIWQPVVNKKSKNEITAKVTTTELSLGTDKKESMFFNPTYSSKTSSTSSAVTAEPSTKISGSETLQKSSRNKTLDTIDDIPLEDEIYQSDEDDSTEFGYKSRASSNANSHSYKDFQMQFGSDKKNIRSETDNPIKSTSLSVTAPVFVFPANKLQDVKVGSRSMNNTQALHELDLPVAKKSSDCYGLDSFSLTSKVVPHLPVKKVDKSVETDADWKAELENLQFQLTAMKEKYESNQEILAGKLVNASKQLEDANEQRMALENEKLSLLASWKLEKNQMLEHAEKLQQELDFMTSNLERTYHQVMRHESKHIEMEKKLTVLGQSLMEEQEKSQKLATECRRLQKLNMLLESTQNASAAYGIGSPFSQAAFTGVAANQQSMFMPEAPGLRIPFNRSAAYGLNGVSSSMMTASTSANMTTASSSGMMAVPKPAADGSKSKQNFDKILARLSGFFPDMRSTDLSRYVQAVRASRNNSLTGLKMQEIVSLVQTAILNEKAMNERERMMQVPAAPPVSLASIRLLGYQAAEHSNSGPGSSVGDDEMFEEEEDPCIICHEELAAANVTKLDCGHNFHTKCIRTWFKEQSTCPTCRDHSLLHDEFPPLMQSGGGNAMKLVRRQPLMAHHQSTN